MNKHRAIPKGYMTTGEIAKKMNVTVRTLQYYDEEGVLSPSAESEGGRRLYTHKDMVKLQHIQSLKFLGFSLKDIKERLPSIDTPEEVSRMLIGQAKEIREKIKHLKSVLESTEALNEEVALMGSVDWEKYADIIALLQGKNDGYWVVKYLSDELAESVRERSNSENSLQMAKEYKLLTKEASSIQKNGCTPKSEQAQALAKKWWDYVLKFTGGDMSLLSELLKMGETVDDSEWTERYEFDKDFIKEALDYYLTSVGYDLTESIEESK